ncbi:hypothetical protein [Sphingomonas morindae]|uniref:Uncharacterized protein n=1 Tax=Sphingomonas morindae TaxID=1541170 RepID=A0ABY4XAE2_9SPHN|nr:hypothetical protein [Sphingomonas morindae]USI73933.1 hypothetical protein LHA26_05560 [Sphingomonas morindae]
MNRQLGSWLLTCPLVKSISRLAIDAGREGLIDLRAEALKAIAAGIRSASLPGARASRSGRQPEGQARMLAARRRGCFLTLVEDTLVLIGSLARDVGVSGSVNVAVLHVRVTLPQTVLAALPNRSLGEVIDIGRLPLGTYSIKRAELSGTGTTFWLEMPKVPFDLGTLGYPPVSASLTRFDESRI